MRNNFFIFTLILFTLSLFQNSNADITIVRGGGGLGELNAHNVLSQMKIILTSCSMDNNKCQLDPKFANLIPNILQKLDSHPINLKFDTHRDTLYFWDKNYSELILNQKYLYDNESESSLSISKITALEFGALINRELPNLENHIIVDFILNWEPNFIDFYKKLNLTELKIIYHHYRIQYNATTSKDFIILEDNKKSELLNSKISSLTQTNNWIIRSQTWEDGLLSLSLEWHKDYHVKRAILVIYLKVEQGNFLLEQSKFELRNLSY